MHIHVHEGCQASPGTLLAPRTVPLAPDDAVEPCCMRKRGAELRRDAFQDMRRRRPSFGSSSSPKGRAAAEKNWCPCVAASCGRSWTVGSLGSARRSCWWTSLGQQGRARVHWPLGRIEIQCRAAARMAEILSAPQRGIGGSVVCQESNRPLPGRNVGANGQLVLASRWMRLKSQMRR